MKPTRNSLPVKNFIFNLYLMYLKMKVELNIFSGRPNPTWALLNEQVIELLSKISSLKPTGQIYAEPGLGYRGFTLRLEEENPDIPRRIDINQGVVIVHYGNGTSKVLEDNGRAIEHWLVKTGQHCIDPNLANHLENELKK
jgi:hypothetical protein